MERTEQQYGFVVTERWMASHKTSKGGYTREQLAQIGVGWPPPPGWKKMVIGRTIPSEAARAFERLAGSAPGAVE